MASKRIQKELQVRSLLLQGSGAVAPSLLLVHEHSQCRRVARSVTLGRPWTLVSDVVVGLPQDLQRDPPTSCSAGPAGDDLFHWQVSLTATLSRSLLSVSMNKGLRWCMGTEIGCA